MLDGWLGFYDIFNSISDISGRWKDEHKGLGAMKRHCCVCVCAFGELVGVGVFDAN